MLRPLDEEGRPRPLFLVLFAMTVAGYTGLAIFATVAGALTAPLLWLVSGVFLFIAAMMIFAYVMIRRERAKPADALIFAGPWGRVALSLGVLWIALFIGGIALVALVAGGFFPTVTLWTMFLSILVTLFLTGVLLKVALYKAVAISRRR